MHEPFPFYLETINEMTPASEKAMLPYLRKQCSSQSGPHTDDIFFLENTRFWCISIHGVCVLRGKFPNISPHTKKSLLTA